nr:unnamed protein product [Callosobruchus chinensis]
MYFEVLDKAVGCIEERFTRNPMTHLSNIEQFLTKQNDKSSSYVKEFYGDDFDVDRLVLHRIAEDNKPLIWGSDISPTYIGTTVKDMPSRKPDINLPMKKTLGAAAKPRTSQFAMAGIDDNTTSFFLPMMSTIEAGNVFLLLVDQEAPNHWEDTPVHSRYWITHIMDQLSTVPELSIPIDVNCINSTANIMNTKPNKQVQKNTKKGTCRPNSSLDQWKNLLEVEAKRS